MRDDPDVMLQNYSIDGSDLHFMIANITESLPLQINLGQPPRPLTQGIIMTSDWSSQSAIYLLIGQYGAETSLTWILILVTLPFQLNPIQLITYPPAHFGLNTKSPGYVKHDATATTLPMPQNSHISIQHTDSQ